MNQNNSAAPYRPLGQKLKALRTQANESLAEASGAVEIDVRELAGFELGQARPSEEVLLLLISHFGAKDDEAIKLWELAGYGTSRVPMIKIAGDSELAEIKTQADEPRILFTDTVDVVVNNYGVVMSFMQGAGSAHGPKSVARVGMSREHAKSVLQILKMTLAQTEAQAKLRDKNSPSDI